MCSPCAGFCRGCMREKFSEKKHAACLSTASPNVCTAPRFLHSVLSLTAQLTSYLHTHAHTHHHSYYCLILISNLSLLPSFSLPSPSISLKSSRRAWERDTSVIVISMETAQQQAWRWQPIAGLRSSASHPMAQAGEGGGHTRRSYGRQGECSGRHDQERSLPGWTENFSILMLVEFAKLQDFYLLWEGLHSWSHSRRFTPSIIHMRAAISIRFIKSHSIIADCDPINGNPFTERLE